MPDADGVEFYHDLTGLHRGAAVRADFARLTQQCPRAKGIRRELVPGTLRVYPIARDAVVETGEHRFIGAMRASRSSPGSSTSGAERRSGRAPRGGRAAS